VKTATSHTEGHVSLLRIHRSEYPIPSTFELLFLHTAASPMLSIVWEEQTHRLRHKTNLMKNIKNYHAESFGKIKYLKQILKYKPKRKGLLGRLWKGLPVQAW